MGIVRFGLGVIPTPLLGREERDGWPPLSKIVEPPGKGVRENVRHPAKRFRKHFCLGAVCSG